MTAKGERHRAKVAGELRYFTGLPCKNGHISERLTSIGQCLACGRSYQARYAAEDPIAHREKCRARYAANPALYKRHSVAYYATNKQRLKGYKKTYNHANLARWREIDAGRRRTDLTFRLKKAIRARLASAIKRGTKTGSAIAGLGCSVDELKTYLAKRFSRGMSWDNWPRHWHIDHIRALCSFDLADPVQLAAACHYTNLQPLLVGEHRVKTTLDRKMEVTLSA